MKLLSSILLLCLAYTAQAQQYFNKRYALHSANTITTSVVPRDGKYYTTSVVNDSSNLIGGVYTLSLGVNFSIRDSMGNLLSDSLYHLLYNQDFYAYNNSLFSLPDKGFLLALSWDEDTAAIQYMRIIRYDSTGHVLWSRLYDKPFCADSSSRFWQINDIKPSNNGGWVVFSTYSCPFAGPMGAAQQTDWMLTMMDSNFNILWNHTYGNPSLNDNGGKIIVLPDGFVLGGGLSNDFYVTMAGYQWQAKMIKTDTAGNQLWQWLSDPAKLTYSIQDVIRTQDGGYLYCGLGDGIELSVSGVGEMKWKGWIEKLDSNRNVVWNDTIGNTHNSGMPLIAIKELPNGQLVAGGGLGAGFVTEAPIYGREFACLLKYTANGELIWQRKYDHMDDSLFVGIYDMRQTPDGGFVIAGESDDPFFYYGPTNQQGWLIKVDSNGCSSLTDTQCHATVVNSIKNPATTLKLWPNPTHDAINVQCGAPLQGASISISDVTGRLLLQQPLTGTQPTSISLSSWPSRLYIYQISSQGQVLQTGRVVKW